LSGFSAEGDRLASSIVAGESDLVTALLEMSKSWILAEEFSQAKAATLRFFFGLMIGQRRCWQAIVPSNFRYAFVDEHQRGHDLQVVDCKEVKSLIEAVALEGIRKVKVVEAF
jgi:hypothetical protein